MLRRRQWFEFCDQPWVRGCIREAFLDCLSFTHNAYQPCHNLHQPFAENSARAGATTVLDLASGSGEPIALLLAASDGVALKGKMPKFIVSDLYPDAGEWKLLQEKFGKERIEYIEKPLDVLAIPVGISPHWSIFAGFHHLPPEAAQKLLQQFCDKAKSLTIIEVTRRRWHHLLMIIIGLPVNLIVPFVARKFTWKKFIFTTLIPIVPVLVTFDGVVSVMRSYTKDEILALLPPGQKDRIHVDYREVNWRRGPLKVTMLTLTKN